MVLGGLGSVLAPAIGNSLSSAGPGLPFLFWAALTLLAFVGLFGSREKAVKPVLVVN